MKTIYEKGVWLPCVSCAGPTENKHNRRYAGPRCQKCYGREWAKKNPEKKKATFEAFLARNPGYHTEWKKCLPSDERQRRNRKYSLKKSFDITPEQYDLLFEKQGGLCAVCRKSCATGRRLAVDHCHKTGKIRGLLCAGCNRGLGFFMDSLENLEAAKKYLNENS